MILFKKYHVPLILDLTKDVTRRQGKKRWNIGAFHQLKTGFDCDRVFAGAKIDDVYDEKLGDISGEHVLREGYQTQTEYFDAFLRINGLKVINLDMIVNVVEFTVMGLMEITRSVEGRSVVALVEYDDPLLDEMREDGLFHPSKFRIRAVNINPSEHFTCEALKQWQIERKNPKESMS